MRRGRSLQRSRTSRKQRTISSHRAEQIERTNSQREHEEAIGYPHQSVKDYSQVGASQDRAAQKLCQINVAKGVRDEAGCKH